MMNKATGPLRVALLGCGVVGSQTAELLTEQADPLLRAGLNATQLEYVRLLEQGFIKSRTCGPGRWLRRQDGEFSTRPVGST